MSFVLASIEKRHLQGVNELGDLLDLFLGVDLGGRRIIKKKSRVLDARVQDLDKQVLCVV